MIVNNLIPDLLSAPLDPEWTIEGLAEKVLGAVAAQAPEGAQEFIIIVDESADRQVRQLIRPLLAYLAIKSSGETGEPVNLYGGHLSFKRPSPTGPVWVFGEFENRSGSVRVSLRRSSSPDTSAEIGLAPATLPSTALDPARM